MGRFVNAHALIIGVADYTYASPLPHIVIKDARDMAAILTDPERCGYNPSNVQLLLEEDATAANIRTALAELAGRVAEDEPFLLYFSGHGDRSGPPDDEHSFLLLHDSDPEELDTTAISDSELFNALREIRSQRQVLIVDACHAGGLGGLKSNGTLAEPKGVASSLLDRLGGGVGLVVLASSRSNEFSHVIATSENSVFTESLLRALAGAGRNRGDGTVGVLDVFDYVSRDVPLRQRGQTPVFKADRLESNFAIAAVAVKTAKVRPAESAPSMSTASLFAKLYPQGPMENELWSRAGGDVARLSLAGNGLAQWHRAITLISNGGGGLDLTTLVQTVLKDFPDNDELSAVID